MATRPTSRSAANRPDLDTQANMASPLAAGLFQRAIWESGIQEPAPLTWAEQHAEAFATAAGCATGSNAAIAKCLRGLTAAQIMNLQNSGPYGTENGVIADGQILLTQGIAATFQSGKFNHVPVISGSTHDEANFGFAITEYSENPRVPFTATDFTNYVTSTYTGNNGPGGSPPTYPPGTVDKVFGTLPALRVSNAPTGDGRSRNRWERLFCLRTTKAQSNPCRPGPGLCL